MKWVPLLLLLYWPRNIQTSCRYVTSQKQQDAFRFSVLNHIIEKFGSLQVLSYYLSESLSHVITVKNITEVHIAAHLAAQQEIGYAMQRDQEQEDDEEARIHQQELELEVHSKNLAAALLAGTGALDILLASSRSPSSISLLTEYRYAS